MTTSALTSSVTRLVACLSGEGHETSVDPEGVMTDAFTRASLYLDATETSELAALWPTLPQYYFSTYENQDQKRRAEWVKAVQTVRFGVPSESHSDDGAFASLSTQVYHGFPAWVDPLDGDCMHPLSDELLEHLLFPCRIPRTNENYRSFINQEGDRPWHELAAKFEKFEQERHSSARVFTFGTREYVSLDGYEEYGAYEYSRILSFLRPTLMLIRSGSLLLPVLYTPTLTSINRAGPYVHSTSVQGMSYKCILPARFLPILSG